MGAVFTGLLDKNCKRIYEGDRLRVGMRRGDSGGWTTETVARTKRPWWKRFSPPSWSDWCLIDIFGAAMDMQLDQELREKPPTGGER